MRPRINIEVNFARLDPSVANRIYRCIEAGQMFAIAGDKSISVFDVKNLASVWFGNSRMSEAGAIQKYNSLQDLQTAVSLALLSQKTFVDISHILDYCNRRQIVIPQHLLK